MKKLFTFFMAIFGFAAIFAQTIYSENMGTTSSGNPVVTSFNGWQNAAPIVYSGTGSVRTTTPSTGYSGSSGGNNIFLAASGGQTFQISGINTSAYSTSGLQLSFGWLTSTATAVVTVETSTDGGTTWVPLTIPANTGTGWTLKTITSGIPSSSNLSLRFTAPVTGSGMRLDDVKIAYVSSTCALTPGAPTTACDASTLNLDTYTITIPYTGGGTATYSVTATSGTVGGDNPSTVASGNIVITGTVEGTDNTVTITGGTCSYTIPVNAPTNGCKPVNPLPVNEPFTYPAGQALTAQQMWQSVNSGDQILVQTGDLTLSGISGTGSSITFSGAGSEALVPFTTTTSGMVNASFYFSATDYSNVTTDLTETYFALFTSDNIGLSTTARLWIRKIGTAYQFGLGSGTAAADTWSSNVWDVNTPTLLTLSYDFATNTLRLFENQTTAPMVASASVTLASPLSGIGGFMLRQDAANSTPTVVIDALNINTNALVLGVNDIVSVNTRFIKNTLVKEDIYFGSKSSVKIYSMNGQMVRSANVTEFKPMNVSDLAPGMYIVTGTVDGQPVSQKILKK